MSDASENIKVELVRDEDEESYSIKVQVLNPRFGFTLNNPEKHSSQSWSRYLTNVQNNADNTMDRVMFLHGEDITLYLTSENDFMFEMMTPGSEIIFYTHFDKNLGVEMVTKMIKALQDFELTMKS